MAVRIKAHPILNVEPFSVPTETNFNFKAYRRQFYTDIVAIVQVGLFYRFSYYNGF